MAEATDQDTQLDVIIRIARRDRYEDIARETGLAISTISKIKERNESTLALIKDKFIQHKLSKAAQIRDKSLTLIEKKIDKAAEGDKEREEIMAKAKSGEITWAEALAALKTVFDASLADLNSIAKETFNQSRAEVSSLQTGLESPTDTEANLKEIMGQLEAGNEVELQKIIFRPKE